VVEVERFVVVVIMMMVVAVRMMMRGQSWRGEWWYASTLWGCAMRPQWRGLPL
jgi:hypothetical protein